MNEPTYNAGRVLFIDTETSGMLLRRAPLSDPSQPHIVQIATLFRDGPGGTVSQRVNLIRPDGWTIQPGAGRVHGITLEQCEETGVPLRDALRNLAGLIERADVVVAHNVEFDFVMLEIEEERAGVETGIRRARSYCTMTAATETCGLPGRHGGFKWPTLAEAHQFLCHAGFDNQHDALADVLACSDVFDALKAKYAKERYSEPA